MGMLQRLRDAHPATDITAFDGHYRRIGDADSAILDHIVVERGGRRESIAAIEAGRRKSPGPKRIEERLERLVTRFEAAA